MKKLLGGLLLTGGFILLVAVAFTLYAQFALDYSLESLKQALEASQDESTSNLQSFMFRPNLEGLALEEITRKDANFESVALLEHAARSIRDAVEQSGYTKAGVYLVEVLKEKSKERNQFLQMTDILYHFIQSLLKSSQGFWQYAWSRFHPAPPASAPLGGTGVLILGEAERVEKSGKFQEAERYYREFLDRYPARPERGFVTISLAHILTRMRRLDEAEKLLKAVEKEFPGTREEATAGSLLERIENIRHRLTRLPELEGWVKKDPNRLYQEEGGIELALNYLATYQMDKAMSLLEQLQSAPDPRIRMKALFYKGWVLKWQGDYSRGKEIFQLLGKFTQQDEKLAFASRVELAEVHYEKKEYKQALKQYEALSTQAARESWRALSELEQSGIYLFGLGNATAAREHLQKLDEIFPAFGSHFEAARSRLEEAFQISLREEGFAALAQGRTDVALDIFQRYLKKFSRDGQVHSAIGSIYLLRGMLNEAVEEAQLGYGMERDEYAATVLGYIYEKMGKLDEAIRFYTIGTQINKGYVTAQFNLAWAYFMTGRYPEADKILAKLEKSQPQYPPLMRAKIFNNRGCVLWEMGKREDALNEFQEALRIRPELIEAHQNLKLAAGQKPTPSLMEAPRV